MLVLKKIGTSSVTKVIPSGETKEFFSLSLDEYNTFDWYVKVYNDTDRGSFKVNSLYDKDVIDSTEYSYLGHKFNISINVFRFDGVYCKLEVTNNEVYSIECCIKVNTF